MERIVTIFKRLLLLQTLKRAGIKYGCTKQRFLHYNLKIMDIGFLDVQVRLESALVCRLG